MPQLNVSDSGWGTRFFIAGCAVLLLFSIACSSGAVADDAPISESQAKTAAEAHMKSILGFVTGGASAQSFIEAFAPECREGVDAASLEFVRLFIQAFAPELASLEIEELDVGSVTVQSADDGVLVLIDDPTAIRIKVDGEFKLATEVLGEFDMAPTEEDLEPLLLVRRSGQIYVGDCSELQGLNE